MTMNSIIDIPDLLSSINILFLFNNILENSIIEVTRLDEGIVSLNEAIDKLVASLDVITTNTFRKGFDVPFERRITQEEMQGVEEHVDSEKADDGVEKGFKTTHNIIKITKNGLEGIEHLTELPHALEKMKKGVGILDDAMEAIGGLGELSEATGALDVLAAGTGMLAGAEGLAVALIPTGPLGWAIGAGALLSAGVMYATREQESPSISLAGLEDEFRKSEQMNDFRKLEKVYNPKTLEGLQALYDESRSPYMAAARVSKNDWEKRRFFENSAQNNESQDELSGLQIYNQGYLNEWANQYLHFQPLTGQQLSLIKMQDKIEGIKGRLVLESGFTDGGYNKEMAAQEIAMAKKEYAQATKPKILKLPTEEELDDASRAAVSLSPREKKENRKVSSEYAGKYSSNGTRQIIINLNRPMIEHFTIITKDSKESLTNFKHKVEEVLLEILNNVNVN